MKTWNYIIIMVTMIIFMQFTGIDTGSSDTLKVINVSIDNQTGTLNSYDVQESSLWSKIFGAAGVGILVGLVGAVGAVIAGLLGKSFNENLIILPLITAVLAQFIAVGINLITYANSLGEGWLTAIIATIFIPLIVGFALSLVEFFRGTD